MTRRRRALQRSSADGGLLGAGLSGTGPGRELLSVSAGVWLRACTYCFGWGTASRLSVLAWRPCRFFVCLVAGTTGCLRNRASQLRDHTGHVIEARSRSPGLRQLGAKQCLGARTHVPRAGPLSCGHLPLELHSLPVRQRGQANSGALCWKTEPTQQYQRNALLCRLRAADEKRFFCSPLVAHAGCLRRALRGW